jgi:hypothetical protein
MFPKTPAQAAATNWPLALIFDLRFDLAGQFQISRQPWAVMLASRRPQACLKKKYTEDSQGRRRAAIDHGRIRKNVLPR